MPGKQAKHTLLPNPVGKAANTSYPQIKSFLTVYYSSLSRAYPREEPTSLMISIRDLDMSLIMYSHKNVVIIIIIIIIFSSLALEVTHKKARPVQSVLT